MEVVEADERRIRQVVINLLSNAVKFTPEGGNVIVSSARVNGEVHVSVSDTGPGITADNQARIFEDFQQTDLGARQLRGPDSVHALEEADRASRRPYLGRERARQGEHVHVRASHESELMVAERILIAEDNEKNIKLFRDVLHCGSEHSRRRPVSKRSSSRRVTHPTSF